MKRENPKNFLVFMRYKQSKIYIFETIALIVLVSLIASGLYSTFSNNDGDERQVKSLSNLDERTTTCTDKTPDNAISIQRDFKQINVNGEWLPKEYLCNWKCKDGFVEENAQCTDINECNSLTCPYDKTCKNIEGGYVCLTQKNDVYFKIYSNYPASNDGKETTYPFLDEGDIEIANLMLEDKYTVSTRFPPAHIAKITWMENPYDDTYWTFLFYSLRPTRHLLYAWQDTNDQRYKEKLIEITNDFLDNGKNSEYTWDLHATAFRTMVLVNTWWKLRENNVLEQELSEKILRHLKKNGDFMLLDNNFELTNNHGINEAMALYVLSINFPDLPSASKWHEVSVQRLDSTVDSLIDRDGILIENSPYYHFYTMRLYWNIYKYSETNNLPPSKKIKDNIEKMTNYGTYIIQPDQYIPTIGASLRSKVYFSEEYQEIAKLYPEFKYVITQGNEGTMPQNKSAYFPTAGQTIMRSSWDNNFSQHTQIIFDVGPYRTSHSDLDALSFHLYGNGQIIMPDTGLYSYEKDKITDYFKGTSAHNTVVVDNKDQRDGYTSAGKLTSNDLFSYQSGYHDLYENVIHQRGISLIEKDIILIIDSLKSNTSHNYSQTFHLDPSLTIESNNKNNNVIIKKNDTGQVIARLYTTNDKTTTLTTFYGSTEPYKGWCSYYYKITEPCYYISFDRQANSTNYFTLISLKDETVTLETKKIDELKFKITIETADTQYHIDLENLMKENEIFKVKKDEKGILEKAKDWI